MTCSSPPCPPPWRERRDSLSQLNIRIPEGYSINPDPNGFEVSKNGSIMLSVNRSRMMVWDTANDKSLWRVTY